MRAILARDLVAEGSRERSFLLRFLAGGAAAFLLSARALTTLHNTALDEAGAAAFAEITGVLFLLLAAATPALLVPALLGERRAGTLDLLVASPIGATGLVAGKLLARLGTVLGLATAALPPLSLALLFGGTSWGRLFDAGAGLLGTALEAGALGLLVSCGARRTATAAILAYLLPALHWGLPPMLAGVGLPLGGSAWGTVLEATTPLPFLEGSVPGAGVRFLLFSLLLAAASLPAAAWLLLREESPVRLRARPRFRIPGEDRLRTRLFRDNPVAWKESLFLDTAWSRGLVLLLAGLLLAGEAAFVAFQAGGKWSREANQAWLLVAFAALAAVASIQGAASSAAERSGASFDILRASPLTSRDIARGKLAGLTAGLGFLMIIPFGHLLLSVAAGWLGWIGAALTAVAAAFVVVNAAVHGLAWGFAAGSPAGAVAGAATFAAFAHGSCGLLCPAALGALLVKAVRKSAPSFEFLGLIVLPAILCGPPYFLLYAAPLVIDESLEPGSSGGFALLYLVGVLLLLAMTALFAVFDARRMAALLERETYRLSVGGDPSMAASERVRFRLHVREAGALARARRTWERDAAEENARGGRP